MNGSPAAAMDPVGSDTVAITYDDGQPFAVSSGRATEVAVSFSRQPKGRWVFLVMVQNNSLPTLTVGPEDVRFVARRVNGREDVLPALTPNEALALERARIQRKLALTTVANGLEELSARDEAVADQEYIGRVNDLEYQALSGSLGLQLSIEEENLLRRNTLVPGGDVVGNVWLDPGDVEIRHLIVSLDIGPDHHVINFGDPGFVSGACTPDNSGGQVGWLPVSRLARPRLIQELDSTKTVEIYSLPFDADGNPIFVEATAVCTLWPDADVLVNETIYTERYGRYWVSVAFE